MFDILQKTITDLQYMPLNFQNLSLFWRGHVYVELPFSAYDQWIRKIQMATSNYCIVFTKVPMLFDHSTLYNFVFFQSELIIFPPQNYIITIGGFYKQLSTEKYKELYNFGKVYKNNKYTLLNKANTNRL